MSLVSNLNIETKKKRRGRRCKVNPVDEIPTASLLVSESSIETICDTQHNNIQIHFEEYNEPILKKRGRKPKGGKLILKTSSNDSENNTFTNVILHLKCSLGDLTSYNAKMNKMVTNPIRYNPDVPPDILAYNSLNENYYNVYTNNNNNDMSNNEENGNDSTNNTDMTVLINNNISSNLINAKQMQGNDLSNDDNDVDVKNTNIREIHNKLKKLKIDLYKNNCQDKKSACFWCTYDFDNPVCYIPKYVMDGKIHVYGSFCRPECSVAFLMKENIDDSVKFERYHLLNQIYGKAYGYKKNIKPSPNPYYLLEKYYGNLTIQEYRKLLKSDHILMVIDKPITRIMPELYEDTDDNSIYGSVKTNLNSISNTYRVKRANEKNGGPSKSSIIRDKFGLS
jgi:hypothetical protein